MISETIDYLASTQDYLKIIKKDAYCQPIPLMSDVTIGQHTRHFIECYLCLVEQAHSGEVCYDSRQRDKMIETNPDYASAILDKIIQKVPLLDQTQKLLLRTNIQPTRPLETTVERELLYNYEHTTHHLALIKAGLAILGVNLKLPEGFGVAKSTLHYRARME